MNFNRKVFFLAIFGLWAVPGVATGEESTKAIRGVREVAQQLELVQLELAQLRRFMGRYEVEAVELSVSGASFREVYFQAIGMLYKADRLRFECTGYQERELATLKGDVDCKDVSEVVDKSLQVIRSIKKHYGLEDIIVPPTAMTELEDMDSLFAVTLTTNRQLGLMLERPWRPQDVYRQVTITISYVERLTERFPEADSTPPRAPPYEPNKTPKDVMRRLLNCIEIVRRISERSGRTSIEIAEISDEDMQHAAPSDVYDVASLALSELAYLHSELPQARPPRKSYLVGRKFPSDVYQRVGILQAQLTALEKLVAQYPDWLQSEPAPRSTSLKSKMELR